MIKSVSKNTLCQSPMLLGLERFLLAQPLADYVRPAKSQRQQRDQLLQSLRLDDVRFFKPKPSTLQTTKQGFDFPTLGVIFHRCSRVVGSHQNQIFATRQAHPRYPQCQSPDAARLIKDQRLIDGLATKQSLGCNQLAPTLRHLCVVADANAKRDLIGNQPLEPRLAYKLPVSTQVQDGTDPEQAHKLPHQGDSFFSVGVAFLVKNRPQHGNRHAFVNQTEHQNIQRHLSKLPVGAIQSQRPRTLYAAKRNEQHRDERIADFKQAQESLDAFVVRFLFGAASKNRGNLGEVDTANLDQRNEKLRQEVDSSFVPIYIFSKGSLKRANRGHRAFSSQVITVLEKDKAAVAFYAFSKIIFVLY